MFKVGDIIRSDKKMFIELNNRTTIGISKFRIVKSNDKSAFFDVMFLDDNYNEVKYKWYGKILKNDVEIDIDYYRNVKLNKINNNLKSKKYEQSNSEGL